MAPFELKLGPNESYGRAASVKPPPGAKKAQIRAKIRVKLQGSAAWAQPLNRNIQETDFETEHPGLGKDPTKN